jgi:hypothetical protein
LGSRITTMLTQQLNGSLSYEPLGPGCRVRLSVPMPDRNAPTVVDAEASPVAAQGT